MKELGDYYALLGIAPGASATEIQSAFRSQIKEAHPDRSSGSGERARLLIEAYKAIRHAPLGKTVPGIGLRTGRPAPAPGPVREKGGAVSVDEPRLSRFFDKLSDIIYADDNEWAVYGAHDEIQEFLHFKSRKKQALEKEKQAREYFDRAEELLKLTVARYNRMSNKKSRSWSRSYIANLVELKVLYRDVVNRYPSMATLASQRLGQIEDLIWEIRKM
ncbi:MAG: J domain-containing protein [Spirochaetales bacterium]|nr:J domain-containing protein [Spirochaetales bacterium]